MIRHRHTGLLPAKVKIGFRIYAFGVPDKREMPFGCAQGAVFQRVGGKFVEGQ